MSDKIAITRRLRTLRRHRIISPAVYGVGETILWSLGPGSEVSASYARIAALAGVARSTAQAAVAQLRALGVLAWRQTRLRVRWALGIASRQWRNAYRFLPPRTDTDQPAADRRQGKKVAHEQEAAPAASEAERQALLVKWGLVGAARPSPGMECP